MAFGCVKWPFMENAERKMRSEGDRWDASYPVWVPCCLMIPFGWLFQGRLWPSWKKGRSRRKWETEQKLLSCPAKNQTKYPETSISPCSLQPRDQDDNISTLSVAEDSGIQKSRLSLLPLEIRREIYGYVLGREENCLVLLPFKIRAVPLPHPIVTKGNAIHPARNVTKYESSFWPHRPALLRTCRQVYQEAVNLLYSANVFVIKHTLILNSFAKRVHPARLNAIRSLRVSIQQQGWCTSCECDRHASCILPQQAWRLCWETIAGMQHLTTLHVDIDYPMSKHRGQLDCQMMLRDLMALRGIAHFSLELNLWSAYTSSGGGPLVVPVREETKAIMARIKETARLPRAED